MTDLQTPEPSTPGRISRRTIVKSAAWSAPIIGLAVSTPAASASVTPAPDMTPTIVMTPKDIHGTSPVDIAIFLTELNGYPSTGPVEIVVTRDSTIGMQTDTPTFTGTGWTLTSVTNPNYYFFTYNPIITASSTTSTLHITAQYVANASVGGSNVTTVIQSGSGGDSNSSNNNKSVSYTFDWQ